MTLIGLDDGMNNNVVVNVVKAVKVNTSNKKISKIKTSTSTSSKKLKKYLTTSWRANTAPYLQEIIDEP